MRAGTDPRFRHDNKKTRKKRVAAKWRDDALYIYLFRLCGFEICTDAVPVAELVEYIGIIAV